MVAMAMGALIVAASLQVYASSQRAYRVSETVAQLQETARHALALLELDVRMAGYWGSSPRSDRIANGATPTTSLPAELAPAASGINACGPNWAIHVTQSIYAMDETYGLACNAFNRRPQTDSDVLVVRHASTPLAMSPSTPRLRLVANHGEGSLWIAPCTDAGNRACAAVFAPMPTLAGATVHDLLAHAYYVSRDATGRNGFPSLRRKRLVGGAGGATIQDEEIIAGVENLQLELGVRNGGDGAVLFRDPRDVDFDDTTRPVVAVRLWLLVRSESIEPGFIDDVQREFPPARVIAAPNDAIRRLLVSSTIYLRNIRP